MKQTKIIIAVVLVTALAVPTAAMASPIKVPIYGSTPGAKVKPAVTGLSVDGSQFFGGRTGKAVIPAKKVRHWQWNFGHLRWIQYHSYTAEAKGVEWVRFYTNSGGLQAQPFHIDGVVDLTWYAPRHGVFTKLTVTETYTHNAYRKSLIGKTRTYNLTYPS